MAIVIIQGFIKEKRKQSKGTTATDIQMSQPSTILEGEGHTLKCKT